MYLLCLGCLAPSVTLFRCSPEFDLILTKSPWLLHYQSFNSADRKMSPFWTRHGNDTYFGSNPWNEPPRDLTAIQRDNDRGKYT